MLAFRRDDAGARADLRAEEPVAADGEAIVRITRVGVDELDADCAAGKPPFAGFRGTLGHRGVGVVESVRTTREDQRSLVGKRVVLAPIVACARCEACRGGLAQHCASRTVLGLAGRDGCFAEKVRVPIVNLAVTPKAITDDQAVTAVPLAAALHAARLVPITNKTYVTVIGDSLVGLLAAQVMARLNASVRLVGANPERFTRCERWGVKHRHLDEVGRRQDQDVVLDASGDAAFLSAALGLVRPRGKIICHGRLIPAPGPSGAGFERIADLEVEVLGARGGRVADAVECLLRGDVEVLSLLSRRFKLADLGAAWAATRDPGTICVQAEP